MELRFRANVSEFAYDFIRKAESPLFIISEEIDREFAKLALDKAYEGNKVVLGAKDSSALRWLKAEALNYRGDEEVKIVSALRNLEREVKASRYYFYASLISGIVLLLVSVVFPRFLHGDIFMGVLVDLPVLGIGVILLASVYPARKGLRNLETELSMRRDDYQKFMEEVKEPREKIRVLMEVYEIPSAFVGTIVAERSKFIAGSFPLRRGEQRLHSIVSGDVTDIAAELERLSRTIIGKVVYG